jgi:hypothetical protein
MSRKRYTPEQISGKLREAEVAQARIPGQAAIFSGPGRRKGDGVLQSRIGWTVRGAGCATPPQGKTLPSPSAAANEKDDLARLSGLRLIRALIPGLFAWRKSSSLPNGRTGRRALSSGPLKSHRLIVLHQIDEVRRPLNADPRNHFIGG